ncbi:MAG TPA: carbon-nitrogen hydrolase family protein [Planktothrix sp.]|jgi:predicted amidohydrolase
MKIALAQIEVGFDKAANLHKIELLTAQAASQGVDLIVFPEAAMYNFSSAEELIQVAEPVSGPFVTALQEIARLHHIWLMAGMFEGSADAHRVYNTVVLLDDRGKFLDSYRKIHLYDAFGKLESENFLPGDGAVMLFECAGMMIGTMICYDLRFPELARHLAYQGAQAIVVPAAWYSGPLKEAHLEIMCRARAIENNVYLAAAVQVGQTFTGNSMVVDPMGVIQACRGELEGLLVSELLPERIESARALSPTLKNRRTDVYSRWRDTKWYE